MKILILFVSLPLILFAQKEKNHWYFGKLAGLDFSSGSPIFDSSDIAMRSFLSSTSISDSMGNLLFYANSGPTVINGNDTLQGVVCNRFHQIMPNGVLNDTLATQWFQYCIIIPKVGDKNKYYLFTINPISRLNKGLRYSIIDISLDGGKGDVLQKGIPIIDSIVDGIVATAHANGLDYWLMVGRWNGLTNYYAYKVSASGISLPVITQEDSRNFYGGGGAHKFSPNGKLFYTNTGIYDFDNNTGHLSNFRSIGKGGLQLW